MSSSSRPIAFQSSDGEILEMDESVARLSPVIRNMMEDDSPKTCIPALNVTGNTLSRIINYCRKHVTAEDNDGGALKSFDKEFVAVDDATLVRLVNAAISLEIESLIALTCQALADRLKGSSADQIRKRFNIDNDFTPEEEEKIRRENAWAFH